MLYVNRWENELTYYVVAQLGLNNLYYYAFDYMLETMFSEYLLLFMLYIYLLKTDADRRNLLIISSENGDISVTSKTCTNIQSAENCKEFSETIWFAGIVDGDGNFDLRNINNKLVFKAIRIKLHDRDVRILTYIQNISHMGRIRADKNKPLCKSLVPKKKCYF